MKVWGAMRLFARILRGGEGSDQARFEFAEKLTRVIHPDTRFSEYGKSYLEDREFVALYERFEPRNNHSIDRKFALAELWKLCEHVPGDTAECGVFHGASSYLICRATRGSGRTHHVFDSFEGLSGSGGEDGSYWQKGDLAVSLEEVRANLGEFDFVQYHKGWIPERFEDVADRRFAFVHVDVDLYEPTRDSLEFFFPRLSPGGVLVCDDYGFLSCPGARRALDEYFAERPESVVHLPTGQGFVQRGPDAGAD